MEKEFPLPRAAVHSRATIVRFRRCTVDGCATDLSAKSSTRSAACRDGRSFSGTIISEPTGTTQKNFFRQSLLCGDGGQVRQHTMLLSTTNSSRLPPGAAAKLFLSDMNLYRKKV